MFHVVRAFAQADGHAYFQQRLRLVGGHFAALRGHHFRPLKMGSDGRLGRPFSNFRAGRAGRRLGRQLGGNVGGTFGWIARKRVFSPVVRISAPPLLFFRGSNWGCPMPCGVKCAGCDCLPARNPENPETPTDPESPGNLGNPENPGTMASSARGAPEHAARSPCRSALSARRGRPDGRPAIASTPLSLPDRN